MRKVLTAAQMREVDRLTTERYGIPSIILMENAAHAVARVITEKLGGSVGDKRILILCGKGNNGGDGAALARILMGMGAFVDVFLFGSVEKTRGDARTNFEVLRKTTYRTNSREGVQEIFGPYLLDFEEVHSIQEWVREYSSEPDPDCVVDALFGTGINGELDKDYGLIFDEVWFRPELQESDPPTLRVAIDIPSGLQSDTGLLGTVNSSVDVTVTFTAPKLANVLPEASTYNGEVVIAPIGSPHVLVDAIPSSVFVSEFDDASEFLRTAKFEKSSYKNKRGHVLMIAGSRDYSGAAVLCGNAAIRSGCGLVTIATPESSRESIVARVSPEVMVRGVAETANGSAAESAFDEIVEVSKNVDVIAIGSGMSSKDDETKRFVKRIVDERTTPVVIDADGLTALSPWHESLQKPDRKGGRNRDVDSYALDNARASALDERPLILTPHEGEFRRLLGVEREEFGNIIRDRVQAVRDFATTRNVILVLKGERVLIGEPNGNVVVNPTGNSGLGKAGNGDTLTGILAGFLAQAVQMKIDIFETVIAAVYVAGMAGDIAEKKYGKRVMTASDVRECLTEVFAHFENQQPSSVDS